MKSVAVLAILASVAMLVSAAPQKEVEIVNFESENRVDGYKYTYETSDGTKKREEGQLKNAGTDDEVMAVEGEYEYVGDDGKVYKVHYTADENGFQPDGDHIPKK